MSRLSHRSLRLRYTYLGYNPPGSGYSYVCYPRSGGSYWLETLTPWSPGLCPQESANTKDTSQISPLRMLLPVFPHYILLLPLSTIAASAIPKSKGESLRLVSVISSVGNS